jgi:hypothetical protein
MMKSSPLGFERTSKVDQHQTPAREPVQSSGSWYYALSILFTIIATVLVIDAIVRSPGAIELGAITLVQELDFLFAPTILHAVDFLTSFLLLMGIWVIVTVGAVAYRRWGLLIATLIAPVAALLAIMVDLIAPPRPPLDPLWLERVTDEVGIFSAGFGQIIGIVLLFGLFYLLTKSISPALIRVPLQLMSGLIILLVGPAQLWAGAIWPSEMILAYAIGGLFFITLAVIANMVDAGSKSLPLISAASVLDDERIPHTRALTSTIVFNGSTVSKVYRPGFLPRAIYWLAFQAEFPYMRNQAALQAAVLRRNLIGMFTEYWYGSSHVAKAIGIDRIGDRYAITSEYVDGSEPEDRDAAKAFLRDLASRFESAGFPTWQIDPRQPRATDNVLVTDDGTFQVVDLESGLVSPLASMKTWRRAFQRAQVPIYDDIFFDITRDYIERHESDMRAKMGDAWVNELRYMLSKTQAETQKWHDSEPRIWSRLLGRKRQTDESSTAIQRWVVEWFDDAIDHWRAEGRITDTQRLELRSKVRSPQFAAVLPHFAVHLGTSSLLRFPLGTVARTSYTGFNMAKAAFDYSRERISRSEQQTRMSIHSPLVLLISAIPGFGAFAYMASQPVRSDHLLVRIGLDAMLLKIPARLYERTRLRWFVTDTPQLVERGFTSLARKRETLPRFRWAEEHRSVQSPDPHPWTMADAAGYGIPKIV